MGPAGGLTMIIKCCQCGRIKVRGGSSLMRITSDGSWEYWYEPIDPDPAQPNVVSHSYCPQCAMKERDRVRMATLRVPAVQITEVKP